MTDKSGQNIPHGFEDLQPGSGPDPKMGANPRPRPEVLPAILPAVLFVCLGNICRSPTAQAVFAALCARERLGAHVESAGTGGWHKGEPPDPRAVYAGEQRGYSFDGQTARQIESLDFARFDYILAMDEANLSELRRRAPLSPRSKMALFLDYAPHLSTRNVPDPYYGGDAGFEEVLSLIEAASRGLIAAIKMDHAA